MRKLTSLAALALALTGTGCWHAVIDTGLPPSGQTIERPWAMSFAYGLVPPPIVETAAQCPGGVSKVETQHSFLNGLVAAITFEIVTPIDIRVTCAGGRRGALVPTVDVPAGSVAALTLALELASERARQLSAPVYVRITE